MSHFILDEEPRPAPGWDADRAGTVITGLRRLTERGLLSETECQHLMLRIASVSSTAVTVPRHVPVQNETLDPWVA